MRFALRALLGLCLSLAFLGAGGWSLWRAAQPGEEPPPRPRAERAYTAAVGVLERVEATPRIEAFGVIRSWRTLQLRAAGPGRIVALSPDFRDGARVTAGDLLFRIDPADYEAALAEADLALAEARADAAEARQRVEAAALELDAALAQADLRAAALERVAGLADRGFSASAAVDEARLADAQARQTVAAQGQAVVAAELAVERAALAVRRAELTRAEAERRLAETEARAPFDGVLTGLSAALGDMAAANQALGALLDPTALEAELRIGAADFARLLDSRGALVRAPVDLSLALDDRPLTVRGALDRFAAEAGGGAGRAVYARLELDARTVLRPGDFVSAAIAEPPLRDVAVVPAAALTEDGRLLLVGEDDRLSEIAVRVLRRFGDAAIVVDAPFGARYVLARAPQLGVGTLVRPAAAAGPAGPEAG